MSEQSRDQGSRKSRGKRRFGKKRQSEFWSRIGVRKARGSWRIKRMEVPGFSPIRLILQLHLHSLYLAVLVPPTSPSHCRTRSWEWPQLCTLPRSRLRDLAYTQIWGFQAACFTSSRKYAWPRPITQRGGKFYLGLGECSSYRRP